MKDYTNKVEFWDRLKIFVGDVQTGCAAGEEEKTMIMNECNEKINSLKSKDREIGINEIIDVVCSYFKIKDEVFHSKKRNREIVQSRQIAMYLSVKHTHNSLVKIGEKIGGKDHATVLYSRKHVSDLIETDKEVRRCVEEIENILMQ